MKIGVNMKNKKIIILGSILLLILVTSCILYQNKDNKIEKKLYETIYEKYSQNIDDGVNKLMNSKEYKEMNEAKQIEEVGNLLKQYESSGIIRNLYYDNSQLTYSFQYAKGELEGTLGGVMLKSFDPMTN